jgi:electron transfer flavoprotein alpha subunit
MTAEILVYCERSPHLNELLGKARQAADKAGWKVSTVLMGSDDVDLGSYGASGADRVYWIETETDKAVHPEIVVAALTEVIQQVKPGLVLVGATKLGLEVAPRVAERTHSGYAAWAVDFEIDPQSGATKAQCMLFSGIGKATYQFNPQTILLSSAPGVFTALEIPDRKAQAETISISPGSIQMEILEKRPKSGSGVRLEEANLVVDVGQGVKDKADLEMVRSLAALLDGQVACSRPIASERDWFPEWLGLSGMKISPELCLTVGVSGQIQHIVGIRDSRLIAAVNNDENAAIFSQADYGVVADLYEFLPVFTERLKARGIKPGWVA